MSARRSNGTEHSMVRGMQSETCRDTYSAVVYLRNSRSNSTRPSSSTEAPRLQTMENSTMFWTAASMSDVLMIRALSPAAGKRGFSSASITRRQEVTRTWTGFELEVSSTQHSLEHLHGGFGVNVSIKKGPAHAVTLQRH